VALFGAVGTLLSAHPAKASEGGASLYLLGSGGAEAAVLPPLQGVYLDNTAYYYSGSAGGSKSFVVGGNVVAGLNATIVADFPAVVWVPSTHVAGGVLALGAALPVGGPDVDVKAFLTGPLGHQIAVERTDNAFLVGDPILTGALGWQWGRFHLSTGAMLNVPIGQYREGQLANLAFHRWAGDLSVAGTWHDDKSGWDLSAKGGFTFNGTNDVTQYTTGTEFHVEGSVEKTLSKSYSVGLQAYYFDQVTGDSGPGAKLGPFEGQVVGFGGSAAYHFAIGKMPTTVRLRVMTEFDAQNRLSGDSVWLELSVPLSMKLPSAAHD
jgi:hypothetical protein